MDALLEVKKKEMIEELKRINSEAKNEREVVTRLYFTFKGEEHYVEDYSYFTNSNYMNEELLDALKYGRTLTRDQKWKLDYLTNERHYVEPIEDVVAYITKLRKDIDNLTSSSSGEILEKLCKMEERLDKLEESNTSEGIAEKLMLGLKKELKDTW